MELQGRRRGRSEIRWLDRVRDDTTEKRRSGEEEYDRATSRHVVINNYAEPTSNWD